MARRPEKTAVSRGDGTLASGSDLILMVLGEGHLSIHPVADGQTITLGRDPTSDVPLDHPKISWRHATVCGGTPTTVEDAGSTNGVRLASRRLDAGERAPVSVGASFQVGPFNVLVLGARPAPAESQDGRAALVVRDPRPDALSEIVCRIAASDVSVLIHGETGAGKEVLARAVHTRSGRPGAFLGINCAAISEPLFESELFGHERGAFSGAVQAKSGLLESAATGTVFLDEIGDLSLAAQAKLLRAIETREVLRVGGVRSVALDVRFVAATHRDLRAAVASGGFRQDLYFRINGITLVVPPLRERRDAIPVLAQEFLDAAVARANRPPVNFSPAAVAALSRHEWPGNVRELKTVVERAVLLAAGTEITDRHIAIDAPAAPPPRADDVDAPDLDAVAAAERGRIIDALEQCAGNQTKAAKVLGISRASMVHKVALYRIPRPRSR